MFFTKSRTSFARAGAVALVTAAASLAFAGLSSAGAATKPTVPGPPGDNGDVKIHKTTTSPDDHRNQPHVCGFYLVGFNFDSGEQVSWRILAWPPTGNREKVLDGTLTLDNGGHGRTNDLSLPNGHYKLVWNFAGEHGKAKHKVFWVKCKPGTTPSPAPTSSAQPSQTPSTSPSTAPNTTPSVKPSEPPAPTPTPVPTDLPVTG